MSRGATPERLAAARVLARQLQDGGHLDRLLAPERAGLDPRELRRARAILIAVNRHRAGLIWRLAPFLKRPFESQEPIVAGILLVAAAELLLLDGAPPRAAVHQAVEACHDLGQRRRSGFVNAVLRRLSEAPEPRWPEDPLARAELEHSHPRWLLEALAHRVSREELPELAAANNQPAPIYLRAKDPGDDLSDLGAERDPRVPGAWRIDRLEGGVESLAGWPDGRMWVQDGAAQAAVAMLSLRPGERVLDACAAPGGKAFAEAIAVGPEGRVLALDSSERRLEPLAASCARLGLDRVDSAVRDLLHEPWSVEEGSFDAVLLDAPCSGFGVLRRHPDIRWNRRPGDLPALARRQAALLDAVAPAVRAGGRLVYAVCTVTKGETDDVVSAFLTRHADFTLGRPADDLDPALLDGGALKTDPLHHGLDGFYAVRLDRGSNAC